MVGSLFMVVKVVGQLRPHQPSANMLIRDPKM